MHELPIAPNPDPDSTLAYLLWVPLGDGIVLRTSGTWPRTKALYCYPLPTERMAGRTRHRRTDRRCAPACAVAPPSTWSPTGAGRTGPSWSSPPPEAETPCSGSRRAPANKPART